MHMVIIGIFTLTCVATCFAYVLDAGIVVTLPDGKIKGHVLQSENRKPYYAFQEIPYASPPVGDLRFKPPVAPTKWTGTLDATKNTKICYQSQRVTGRTVKETEDCLYLNVYTPENPSGSIKTLLPVFVYIHGGSFTDGDGTIQKVGPKFFIDYNVVIVAINYRLGPLGFLSTNDGVIPGNIGLKDQHFALKWVKDNIKLFGGDPEKITIGGESAGGFSVGYHMLSKQSKGLFRATIVQSGSVLCPPSFQFSPRYIAFQLGHALNSSFKSDDSTELLHVLQKAKADVMSYTKLKFPADVYVGDLLWTPIIEHDENEGVYINGPMHDDIKNGNFNQVPTLLGFNSEEYVSLLGQGTSDLKQRGVAYDQYISLLVNIIFNMTDVNKENAGNELRKIYTNGKFQNNFTALVSYTSDYVFSTPISRHADLQSKYTDVYLYQLSYKGYLGGFKVKVEGVDPNGVGHGEDLGYIWDMGWNSDSASFPKNDIVARNRILKMWSNFITHLNPTPEEDSSLQNVKWPKVAPNNLKYLNIDTKLEVKSDPKQYHKWEKIIDHYALPPIVLY